MLASLVNEREASVGYDCKIAALEQKDNKMTSNKKVCIETLLGRHWNDMKVIRDSGATMHILWYSEREQANYEQGGVLEVENCA